ncbi:MAG: Sec-independent protein translocase subunit TatA/TatB [Actinomycetota bacterium]
MPSIGPEWIVVLAVIVLLFGAKKLPELARSLGRSTSEFKRGVKDGAANADGATSSEPAAGTTTEDKAENPSE